MNYNTNIAIVKDSNINKFISDNVSFSPLEVILSNLELTIYICLYLWVLLIIQIYFKFHLKNYIKLRLSSILGKKVNNSLELIIIRPLYQLLSQ